MNYIYNSIYIIIFTLPSYEKLGESAAPERKLSLFVVKQDSEARSPSSWLRMLFPSQHSSPKSITSDGNSSYSSFPHDSLSFALLT